MAFKILGRDGTQLTTAGSSADHLSAESRKIINVVDPTAAQDVATKNYVDTAGAANALDGTFRIRNTADNTKQLAFDVSAVAPATTRTVLMPNANVDLGLVATAIQSSEKGAPNGVATLNALGKLSSAQVPAIAITETFVVADIAARDALVIGAADGEVQTGDVAVVTDATADLDVAAGGASYIYTGSAWQRLISPTDVVQSVNGQVGVVVLDTDDIAEGATNLYYTSARFDSAFAAKSTSDLAEGSNLYFTTARVLATALAGYVVGADVAIAATDTVLQAFEKAQGQINAAKASAAAAQADATQALADAAAASAAASAAQADATQALSDAAAAQADATQALSDAAAAQADATQALANAAAAQADADQALAESGMSFEAGVAGEAFAADQIWLVRRAKDGETAGRYYKALADSAINSRVVGFIVVGAGALAAADPVRVYKLGTATLGASDTPFAGADLNAAVYLSQTTAGKWTLAPSETAGSWIKEAGFVAETGKIEFQPGLLIQA